MRLKVVISGVIAMLIIAGAVVFIYWKQYVIPADRTGSLKEDGSLAIDLAGNAARIIRLKYAISKLPQNGWLSGTMPEIVYHPNKNYFGQDRIGYIVTTRFGDSHQAEITLDIAGINDLPRALGGSVSVEEDASVSITLIATDPDREELSFQIIHNPRHGRLTGQPPHLVYQPSPDFFGTDYFIFQASDQTGSSDPAEIAITVTPVNDPPVAKNIQAVTYREFPITIKLDADDPDSDRLQPEIVKDPLHGSVKRSGWGFVYKPGRHYIGLDRFQYRIFDGKAYSRSAEIKINIYPFKGAGRLTRKLKQVIDKGGVAIGSSSRGGYIFQDGRYEPASILKLATASAALCYLGEDAHFETDFYRDGKNNLYIKGYGDPSITTSEWHRIAAELASKGVFERPIPRIVLDDTAIEKGIDFSGRGRSINYFDAPLGAIPSNYNTAEVNIRPGHRVLPWKGKTPVTTISRRRARGLPVGYQRFSVATEPDKGTLYSGELARAIFRKHGLKNRPALEIGMVPATLGPFYIHRSSRDLREVVRIMLADSSNFIANQLLLNMALDRFGEPARLSQGVAMLSRYLRHDQGLDPNDFTVVEGSGLSRQNRVDLSAMLRILNNFSQHRDLMPVLTHSRYLDLIRIGRHWQVLAKTGTMKGIYTLAGFLRQPDKKWLPFVIMVEGKPAVRAKVLRIICRFFAGDKSRA